MKRLGVELLFALPLAWVFALAVYVFWPVPVPPAHFTAWKPPVYHPEEGRCVYDPISDNIICLSNGTINTYDLAIGKWSPVK